MSRQSGYVIDTNIIIDGDRHYPSDVFPHFWNSIETLVAESRLLCPEEVLAELEEGSDDLPEWVKSVSGMLISPSDESISIVAEITAKHSNWISNSDNWADPWVIAEADLLGWIVVTQEKRMIPKVCQERNVICTNVLGMIRREGWRF